VALPADCSVMSSIEALAATGNSTDPTATAAQVSQLGLPPVRLALAASANTVNAELATASWGVDPAAVSGVYGGAAASGGLFDGVSLLPLLAGLQRSTAEQALSLIGVQKPEKTLDTAAAAVEAASATGTSGAYKVDPLWGKQG
jgi:hypothetical protein